MIGNIVAGLQDPGFVAVGDFESIATASGTGSSGTITFSSIPSNYKHLQIRFFLKGTSTSGGYPTGFNFYLNNDSTAANYYHHILQGNGSSASASAGNTYAGYLDAPGSSAAFTNMYAAGIIDILDYADTNKNTTIRTLQGLDNNSTSGRIKFASMLWNNTAAVNRLDFVADATFLTNWTTASQIALYGIKG